jgi:hypothetical protein
MVYLYQKFMHLECVSNEGAPELEVGKLYSAEKEWPGEYLKVYGFPNRFPIKCFKHRSGDISVEDFAGATPEFLARETERREEVVRRSKEPQEPATDVQ